MSHYSNNEKLIHEGNEEKMQAVSVWGGRDKSGLDILVGSSLLKKEIVFTKLIGVILFLLRDVESR